MPPSVPLGVSRLPQANTRSRSPIKNADLQASQSDVAQRPHRTGNAEGQPKPSATASAANTRSSARAPVDETDRSRTVSQTGTGKARQLSPTKIAPPRPVSSKPTTTPLQRTPSTRRASNTRPPSSGNQGTLAKDSATQKASAPPSSFKAPLPPNRSSTKTTSRSRAGSSSSAGPSGSQDNPAQGRPGQRTSRPNSSQSQAKPPSRPQSASSNSAVPQTRTLPARAARPLSFHAPQQPSLSTSPPKAVASKPTTLHRRNAASASSSSTTSKSTAQTAPVSTPNQPALKRKPPFSSHTQSFSPAKQAPPQQPQVTPLIFRKQQTVLHLALLHASQRPAREAWLASARSQLESQYENLIETYHQSLLLGRMARQQRNLLALTKWTGGNVVGLIRKLSALCTVLDGVTSLVNPRRIIPDNEVPDYRDENIPEHSMQEEGEYTILVASFTEWVSFILSIWEERDGHINGQSPSPLHQSQQPHPAASASTSPHLQSNAIDTPPPSHHQTQAPERPFKQIEGLGEAINAQIKNLSTKCAAYKTKLDEANGEFPPEFSPSTMPSSHIDKRETDKAGEEQVKEEKESTPASLLHLTRSLLQNMTEELQLMREIEAEALIGEKAYVEERLRRMAAEARTMETPRVAGHKRMGSREVTSIFSPGWIGM